MPFLDNDTCAEGGYLFLPRFFSLYDAIHGWMMGQMDGWKASFRPRRPLLYVMYNNRVNKQPQAHHPLKTSYNSIVDVNLTEINVSFHLGNPSCPRKIRTFVVYV
jgi:hypothetical protein